MNTPRVAVIIADSYGEPFESIKSEIQPTLWKFSKSLDTFYIKGNKPNKFQNHLNEFTDSKRYSKLWPIQRSIDQIHLGLQSRKIVDTDLIGEDLHVDIPEGLRYLGLKVMRTLEYLYERQYDVVYKTTLSSLVNQKNFLSEISRIDLARPYYGGTKVNFGSHPFASGANLMVNGKTMEILLSSKRKWNHGLLDDVSLGRLLENKVEISEISTLNVSSLDALNSLTDSELAHTTHFRCKSANYVRNDIEIMRELIKRLPL
jgi:hypothetical protein